MIAMVTPEENEKIPSILDAVRGHEAFAVAIEIQRDFFGGNGWATQMVEEFWRPEDFALIRATLARWLN